MGDRKINKIVIHCTDSPDEVDVGVEDIESWHKLRGWSSPSGISCGYHYVIKRDGLVQKGRPDNEMGAHVLMHNHDSIGIVWAGRDVITPRQANSLLVMARGLAHQYEVDCENILGHYELDPNKTCPNLNMPAVRANLLFNDFIPERLLPQINPRRTNERT